VNILGCEIGPAALYFSDPTLIDSDLLFKKFLHENSMFLPSLP